MKLRNYNIQDGDIIASWIKDEKSLYQWSADRINKFPITGEDINNCYLPMQQTNRFIPLTFVNDKGEILGHIIIRYPFENNDIVVRFGFVIVNPILRGQGYGKKLLSLAIDYAKNNLKAKEITLGVFDNNDNAKHCYLSVGFEILSNIENYKMPIGEWKCIEMQLKL